MGESGVTDVGLPEAWLPAELSALRDRRLAVTPGSEAVSQPGAIGVKGSGFTYLVDGTEPAIVAAAADAVGPSSIVLVSGSLPRTVDEQLIGLGWSFRRHVELMLLLHGDPPLLHAASLPAGLTVHPVGASDRSDAQALSDLAFGLRAPLATTLADPDAGLLLARDASGQAVAMGGWTRGRAGARIATIATHPDHRGRGLGGQLTLLATEAARQAGARFTFLDATDAGAGVYRRVGYRTIGGWRAYHLRPPVT